MATGKKGNAWERERNRCTEKWRETGRERPRPSARVRVCVATSERGAAVFSGDRGPALGRGIVCVPLDAFYLLRAGSSVYARARVYVCASMPIVRHGAFIFGRRVGRAVPSCRSPMCARVRVVSVCACVRAEGVSGSSGFIIRHCAPS